jgi:hypothetical protein
MFKNMGTFDRILRTLLGLVFISLYFYGVVTGGWGLLLLVLGIIFIGTSLVSRCPLYLPFGISSKRKSSS